MSIWTGFIYLGLCVAVGILADKRGRSGIGWLLISLLASPLLGAALVLVLADKRTSSTTAPTIADNRPAPAVFDWPAKGAFDTEVVGESNYQAALCEIVAQLGGHGDTTSRLTARAVLVPYANPQDAKAVRVEIDGHTVGHLSRDQARTYRESLKLTPYGVVCAACTARIVGGFVLEDGTRAHYGVRLQLQHSSP